MGHRVGWAASVMRIENSYKVGNLALTAIYELAAQSAKVAKVANF
jgi:hypothetical protein